MLTLTGKYLGTNREMVTPREGGKQFAAFERVTVDVLVKGRNGNRVEACETVKDFPVSSLPPEGQEVVLEVSVDSYNSRYRLRALGLASGRRLAAAPTA